MHTHDPTFELALFELERQRLAGEISRPRRRPTRTHRTARLRARMVHLLHRDA